MKKTIFLFTTLLTIASLSYTAIQFLPKKINAQSEKQFTLNGFAWSSNIGWISMSGSGYGVELKADDSLEGYAWSSNIGWIKFNPTSGFPNGNGTDNSGAKLEINGNNIEVTGWARACGGTYKNGNLTAPGDCSGSTRPDGWDGWISLSGSGYGVSGTMGQDEGDLSGYAWGDDVVGWINFDGVTLAEAPELECPSYNNQHIAELPNEDSICQYGGTLAPADDGTFTSESYQDSSSEGDTDYRYSWKCGGNQCQATAENPQQSPLIQYNLDAQISPVIVNSADDYCTITWNTPAGFSCVVKKENGVVDQDKSAGATGHQVEVGAGYFVECSNYNLVPPVILKSNPMTCFLNPGVREF